MSVQTVAPLQKIVFPSQSRACTSSQTSNESTVPPGKKCPIFRVHTTASTRTVDPGWNFALAASKGAVMSMTRVLAIEYATRGIRVNAVAPGIIKTPMHEAATHEFLGKLHPVARMGDIADVVGAVLYLETAGFVTGEIVHVDGGLSAGH